MSAWTSEIEAVCQHLAALDPLEVEARYVDNFDRGRQTSLHLFEHVHGDSRDRGPALIDLMQTYEKAGLQFNADELPDHLPVVLEFASTQPPEVAKGIPGRNGPHPQCAVQCAGGSQQPLRQRHRRRARSLGPARAIGGADPEPEMDEVWAEPEAFGGCSTQGQSSLTSRNPCILFVPRAERAPEGVSV